jgi:hypothetical protein
MARCFESIRARAAVSCLSILCVVLTQASAAAGAMLLHVETVSPRVGQRGTTVEITIQGICLKDPREVVFYRPGIKATEIQALPKVRFPSGLAHGGRIEEQIRCKFEIAPDCVPGEYPFRIRTATEITSLGTFHVSPFPAIDEDEKGYNTNDTLATALPVTPNVSVRGKMGPSNRGDVDLYRVPAVAGQRLSAEVDSVRIADIHYGGSEYDLSVRILDESGRELAANDDNPLHLQDPLVAARLPRNGFAFVEVRRSVFVPDNRDYCVHIGTNTRPLAAFPPGGPSGTTQAFTLIGDPLGDFGEKLAIPTTPGTFEHFGDAPSPLLLRSSPYPNVIEDTTDAVTRVEQLPVALNGRIDSRHEVDSYRVSVKQGDRLRIRVFAATLGSPIDPRLRVRAVDKSGKPGAVELEADDAQLPDRDIFGTSFRSQGGLKDILDPSIIWEPRATGDYLIELEDPSGSAGPTAIYRIEVEPTSDAVHTLLTSTAFDWMECIRTSGLAVPQGNRWTVNVSLPRGQGSAYRGPLDLVALGLPAGVHLVSGRVPSGQKLWPVQFVADASTPPGSALITLEARPVDTSRAFQSQSQQRIPFINHPGGDAWRTVQLDRYVLAVTEPAPFSIEIKAPPVALVRGGELAIAVKITRREGFNDPVEFQCDWVSPGIAVQPTATIPAGETEAILRITGEPNAPLGPCPLVVTASTTRDDLDAYLGTGRVRVSSEIVNLIVAEPFVDLASQPESIRRGERKKYAWTVKHKSPFEGNASVRLLGLPKGVAVVEPLPMLTKDSKEIAFLVEATDEALLGSVRGVTCELVVQAGGQEIRQRTGSGTLRIDPKL